MVILLSGYGAQVGIAFSTTVRSILACVCMMSLKTGAGDCTESRDHTLQEVFAKEHTHNNNVTWILRAVGWLVLFIGFNVMTRILVILGEGICVWCQG